MKIVDRIKQYEEQGRKFYSFEFFPPRTPAGVTNLYDRVDRLARIAPAFIDITWGAGGSTADLTMELSTNFQNQLCVETQMHLTCTNMPQEQVEIALNKAKEAGIQNILALRGDPPHGSERWEAVEGGFAHAIDLVKFIRKTYGDYFGISVAGYPEGHIDAVSYEEDLQHLKEKVDAGADMIITQLFYDAEKFLKWVADCRAIGITVPILPGIMPINNYASWKRMTDFCKTAIPQEIRDAIEPIKDDDEKVKEVGVTIVADMCSRILNAGVGITGLHMYTLNLEKSVIAILNALKLTEDVSLRRELPWRARLNGKEDVRPIFWANRPHSYVSRTQTWDEFPNGRWGDNRSPAFGEMSDYHSQDHRSNRDQRLSVWGSPASFADIREVFVKFVRGEVDGLPWSEGIAPETSRITDVLVMLNKMGFLTINSQPAVNAMQSSHPVFGWGGPGGYVYQKAYVEFFCERELFEKLVKVLTGFPSITYNATDAAGNMTSNSDRPVNAVTWGVFPNREVIQPTIVDKESFMVWKDEAFSLWRNRWQVLYDEGTPAHTVLGKCASDLLLCNVVDNDFVTGDVFAPFLRLAAQAM